MNSKQISVYINVIAQYVKYQSNYFLLVLLCLEGKPQDSANHL